MNALNNILNLRGGLDVVKTSSPIIADIVFWLVSSAHPSVHILKEPGQEWNDCH